MSETSQTASHQENSLKANQDTQGNERSSQQITQQHALAPATDNSLQEPPVSQEALRVEDSNQEVSVAVVAPVQADIEELERARSDVSNLYAKVQELESTLDQLEKQNHQLRIAMKDVLDKYDQSENDNVTLRSRIVSMRAPPGQVNDDGYYMQRLNWLNETIQVWAAGAYKDRAKLFCIGCANLGTLYEKFTEIQAKGLLLPICIGMSDECNAVMAKTIDNITLKEREFSKVLIVRQALGQGVLEQFKSNQNEIQQDLINELENVLKHLLPKPQDIRPKLVKITDGAIELANEMTCEQALFKCKIFPSGTAFVDKLMYVPDDNQKGRVYMCTFPLFVKRIYQDERFSWSELQLASVELESAFSQHGR